LKKRTVLLLWLVGFVIALIGSAMLGPSIYAAANNCSTTVYGTQNCSLPISSPLTGIGLLGAVIILIGIVVSVVDWILALIRSASMGSWVWFVVVLLFGSLATLVYALFGPSDRRAPAMATRQASYQDQI